PPPVKQVRNQRSDEHGFACPRQARHPKAQHRVGNAQALHQIVGYPHSVPRIGPSIGGIKDRQAGAGCVEVPLFAPAVLCHNAGMDLPIDAVLPQLTAALTAHGRAVLMAPPGAGKTTRVPLALLPVVAGRIVMLEPRRLAARAAAERMAETLGEPLGRTVGYRIRGEAVPGARIEVVTEGILTRMI